MRKSEESVFPEDIDPLIFYQDASIERKPELGQYYVYLNNNNFDAAKNYLANSTLDYYGAWLLNLVENRLYAIEDNVDEYVGEKPKIVIHSAKEPHDYIGINKSYKFYNWTGNSQPYTIYLDFDYSDYIDDIWYYAKSGEESIKTIRMIVEDEDGNNMTLRQLYDAVTPEAIYTVVQEFSFTGSEQTYIVPKTGWYKIEVWGAQGGVDAQSGLYDPIIQDSYDYYAENKNLGGYAVGIIYLRQGTVLYTRVGSQRQGTHAGYNGGGEGYMDSYTYSGTYDGYDSHYVFMIGSGGGGATHVAFSSGTLSDFENKKDDLIIAAGGGGGDTFIAITDYDSQSKSEETGYYERYEHSKYYYSGGSGGGFIGGLGNVSDTNVTGNFPTFVPARDGSNLIDSIYDSSTGYYTSGFGGSQTWGGENKTTQNADGSFGIGGSGDSLNYATAGGGGGFYGGAASFAIGSSGGGSGWVNYYDLVGRQMVVFNYDGTGYYKDSFVNYKQSDFENYPDTSEESGYYYNNFNLEDGSTTDHKMPTLTGYYESELLPPEASEYALGDGHVRISLSNAGSGIEPTDEELINLVRLYSSNEIAATLEFDTADYSFSELVEEPMVNIVGKYFGFPDFTIKFEGIKSQPQRFELYDGDHINKNYYLTYDENAPLVWGNNLNMYNGKIYFEWHDSPNIYLLREATSQFGCDDFYNYYFDTINNNAMEYRIEDPSVVSVDGENKLHALYNGQSTIILAPKEIYVGSKAYETGYYTCTPTFRVLDIDRIDIQTYFEELPWADNSRYSPENVIFPNCNSVNIFADINGACGEDNYTIITVGQYETGYYTQNVCFGINVEWNVSDNILYDPLYDGQFCKVYIPAEWDTYTFKGDQFTITASVRNASITTAITVAPYQDYTEFLPGYNQYITFDSVGKSMKLPVRVYNGNNELVPDPRFVIKYGQDENTRVVNIDSYGNITALRNGTGAYNIYYNNNDYITCYFTVGNNS